MLAAACREAPLACAAPDCPTHRSLPLPLFARRELAFQLADQFRALGAGMSLRDSVVIGGLDMTTQVGVSSHALCPHHALICEGVQPGHGGSACGCVRACRCQINSAWASSCSLSTECRTPAPTLVQAKELARRPHVVIATPGRLAGLLRQDSQLARAFARAKFLVLDEAGERAHVSGRVALVPEVAACRW